MAHAAHVYQIYIAATPDQVWTAITDSEWTRRYFHSTAFVEPPVAGRPFRTVLPDGRPASDGLMEEMTPPVDGRPGRFVHTWHVLYDAELSAEPAGRVEWPVEAAGEGLTRVRLVHSGLEQSPLTSESVEDGWVWVLDGLKTVLETGSSLPRATLRPVGVRRRTCGRSATATPSAAISSARKRRSGSAARDSTTSGSGRLVVGGQGPGGQVELGCRPAARAASRRRPAAERCAGPRTRWPPGAGRRPP